jgi:hypothetical protein
MRHANKTYIGELFGGSRDGLRIECLPEDFVLKFEDPSEVYVMIEKRLGGIFYYYEDRLLRKLNKGRV